MSARHPTKKKRSGSSNDDISNSFIKNVTSRISSFMPAPMTKWFGSPTSANTNGSAAAAESSDSSTEDEAPEDQINQPPSKKMRFTLPETKSTSTNTESTETLSVANTPTGRSSFRQETNFASTSLSSPIEETIAEPNTSKYNLENNYSSIGSGSVIKKRKSLFDFHDDEEQEKKQPTSISLQSPSEPNFKRRIFGSPFYAGKTRYGGAACSDVPKIKRIQTTLVDKSENNDSLTVSQATRRIMDLLKNYSSPLIEAKRISQCAMTSQSSEKAFTPFTSGTSYRYQELLVPSMATILKLKQRSRLMDSTSAARQIIASNSSSVAFAPYPASKTPCDESKETQDKLTTKVKVNLTRVSRNNKTPSETIEPAPVHLPTAVLQIDQNNLPKFTLGNSVTTSSDSTIISTVETIANATNSTSSTIPTTSTTTVPTTIDTIPISAAKSITQSHGQMSNKAENASESQANVFLFSSPVMINVGTIENCTPLPNYTFVSPERRTMEQSKDKNNSTVAQKETWKCDDCWVTNEFDADKCVCCGAGKATKTTNKTKHSSESWKCDDCWVSNDSNSEKCICCGAGKATKSANKVNHTSETWKCDDCWVSNESNSDRCACCGAKKPTKSASKAIKCQTCQSQKNSDKCIDCGNKIDTLPIVASKWNCQQCWVNNDNDVDKCVCCGAKKSQEATPVANAKFDIASEWVCTVCWIKNMSSTDKCSVCKGENPANPTKNQAKDNLSQPHVDIQASKDSPLKNTKISQSDKWECPNCLVHNVKNRSLCVCCDTEKPGITLESSAKSFNFSSIQNIKFKFGIDPNQNVPEKKPESTFAQLKTPVKQSETNNNNISKPVTFTFGIPQQKTFDKNVTETAEENQTIAEENQTTAEETSKQTFTFGESKIIGSSAPAACNLFSSPANEGSKFPESATPKTSIETDEKVHEVPNIEEPNTAPPNVTQKPDGLFGIPLNTSTVATTVPAFITFGQTGQFTNTQAVNASATTTVDATVPQSKFSFSTSVKPGLQFSSVVTTTSTTSSISFPAVPVSSSISFFQKSEPVHTTSMQLFSESGPVNSSLSLFNKNETTTSTAVAGSSLSSAPVFSFGASTQNSQAENPKFNFTFRKTSEIPAVFNMPPTNAANILSGNGLPSGNIVNTMSGGNGLATGIPATTEGNSLSSNTLASGLMGGPVKKDNIMWPSNNEMGAIKMSSENSLQHSVNNLPAIQTGNLFSLAAKKENTWALNQNTTLSLKSPSGNTVDPVNNSGAVQGTIFGAPDKKENMWSLGNSNSNMFAPNAGANSLQKPATFSFGSSMQFNTNNVTPAPTFGSPVQPQTQNLFGMSSQVNNNQSAIFSATLQNQSPPNIFGTQMGNNTASSTGMFGTPNAAVNHSFGTPTPPLPTFEATPLNPVTPTFNFGAQQTPGVFGFGQQQAQSQGGVYMFEAQSAVPGPQRPFSIGSAGAAPSTLNRRPIRRAFRRTNPR